MATVVNTLIEGLTDKMVQARVNSVDAKPFLFGTHFPVKKVNGFNWRTLGNQLQKLNIAADIHADNGTIARKGRPLMQTATGDIPFIAISRDMKRAEIKDYQTALALAGDVDASALVQYWGEDVDFCFSGVQSELEYIAWALASNAGKLTFTTSNNSTFAAEFDLDYQVDADKQKKYTATNWGTAASADIIGDLATAIKTAKGNGINPKFGFINLNTLYKICSAEQIMKACASYIVNAISMAQTPNLAQLNAALAKQAWLNGLQLIVIDQTITRETFAGVQTSDNPFADDRMILAENARLGTTQYDILRENNPAIIRVERAHTVIKKYGTIEPMSEVTIGAADAVPVFDSAYRNVYLKTDGSAW